MFHWFETRIDPFERVRIERPPDRLWAFYWHFLRPIWPAFVALLVMGFLGSTIEVAMMSFIGNLVDLMKSAPIRRRF